MRKSIHFWTQNIDFFWSCFPVETSKLHQKSMEYDGKTIYKHEIDTLMRFLMVPCVENHQFDEFLSFYFKKQELSRIFKKFKKLLFDPMFKITPKKHQRCSNMIFRHFIFLYKFCKLCIFHYLAHLKSLTQPRGNFGFCGNFDRGGP